MNFLLIATNMSVEITGKNEDRVSGATEESFGRDRQNEKGLRRNGAGLEFNGSPGGASDTRSGRKNCPPNPSENYAGSATLVDTVIDSRTSSLPLKPCPDMYR